LLTNHITAFPTDAAKEMDRKRPFPCTPTYSAAAPEQNSETKRSGQRDSPGTTTMDKIEQQQMEGQNSGEAWGVWPVETEQE